MKINDPHTRRALATALVGLVATLAVLGYLLWGPALDARWAPAGLVALFASVSVLSFGSLTAVMPMLTSMIYGQSEKSEEGRKGKTER